MSGYGKIIDGGKSMRKGVDKPINNKLETFAAQDKHGAHIASTALKWLGQESFSDQHIDNINAKRIGDKVQYTTVKDKARLQPK